MGLTGPKRTGHFHASFACIVLWLRLTVLGI